MVLVVVSMVVVDGAVEVATSGTVVVSEQAKVSHGHPPGQLF